MVDQGVHGAGTHAEEQARSSELAEVAQVVAPVGLRHDGHLIPFVLEYARDDGHAERRMVDIGVAHEKDHVGLLPAQRVHLLLRCWQEVHGTKVLKEIRFKHAHFFVAHPILIISNLHESDCVEMRKRIVVIS